MPKTPFTLKSNRLYSRFVLHTSQLLCSSERSWSIFVDKSVSWTILHTFPKWQLPRGYRLACKPVWLGLFPATASHTPFGNHFSFTNRGCQMVPEQPNSLDPSLSHIQNGREGNVTWSAGLSTTNPQLFPLWPHLSLLAHFGVMFLTTGGGNIL